MSDNIKIAISAILGKNVEADLQKELDKLAKRLKLTIQNVGIANQKLTSSSDSTESATKKSTKAISDYEKEINNLIHVYKMKHTSDQEFLKDMEKLRSNTEFATLSQRKQEQVVNQLAKAEKNFQKAVDAGSTIRNNQIKDIDKAHAAAIRLNKAFDQQKITKMDNIHKEALSMNEKYNTSREQSLQYEHRVNTAIQKNAKAEKLAGEDRLNIINKTNESLERLKIGKDKAFADSRVISEVNKLKQMGDAFRKGEISAKAYALQMSKVRTATSLVGNEFRNVNHDGYSFIEMLSLSAKKIAIWGIGTSLVYGSLRQIRQGLDTLRELDSVLVEVEKVTNLSANAMKRLKEESFGTASAYGRTAQDFLQSVVSFSRAGYAEAAKGLAEVSLLAQNIGELTNEQADKFLLATDAAYQYKGNLEKLTQVLSGVNIIDNKFATSIQKVSEGMTVAGSIAKNAGVEVDELAAAIGTMTAVTQRSGEINIAA